MHVLRIAGKARGLLRRPSRRSATLRLMLVALALDGSTLASAAQSQESSSSDEREQARFEAWASHEASVAGGEVSTLTEVELDGHPGAELVARVCHHDGWSETLLVEQGGHRWQVAHDSWGHVPVCRTSADATTWNGEGDELLLLDEGPGSASERRLAIIDDELVVFSEWHADHEGVSQARWDLASRRSSGVQGRVVPIRASGAAPETGPTFVLAGREQWSGHQDGEVRATVERRAGGTLLLHVGFVDDDRREGLGGDRVQVWWIDPDDRSLQGLDVRSEPTGGLRSTALNSQALPPEVHGSVHGLEVVLPMRLPDTTKALQVPLTVIAYDVDADGTTKLATSEYDGHAESLGLMRYVPGGGDFETAGKRIADASPFDVLPPPPGSQ